MNKLTERSIAANEELLQDTRKHIDDLKCAIRTDKAVASTLEHSLTRALEQCDQFEVLIEAQKRTLRTEVDHERIEAFAEEFIRQVRIRLDPDQLLKIDEMNLSPSPLCPEISALEYYADEKEITNETLQEVLDDEIDLDSPTLWPLCREGKKLAIKMGFKHNFKEAVLALGWSEWAYRYGLKDCLQDPALGEDDPAQVMFNEFGITEPRYVPDFLAELEKEKEANS